MTYDSTAVRSYVFEAYLRVIRLPVFPESHLPRSFQRKQFKVGVVEPSAVIVALLTQKWSGRLPVLTAALCLCKPHSCKKKRQGPHLILCSERAVAMIRAFSLSHLFTNESGRVLPREVLLATRYACGCVIDGCVVDVGCFNKAGRAPLERVTATGATADVLDVVLFFSSVFVEPCM